MKNDVAIKSLDEKGCEIKGGSQQMAAIMLMLIKFNNGCTLIKFVKTHGSVLCSPRSQCATLSILTGRKKT